MVWEIVAIISIPVLLFLGWKKRTSYLGEFFIGLLYGIYWEFAGERYFNYVGFSLYLWKDVPLAIILLWGISIGGFALISDFLQKIFKISKNKKLTCLFFDVVVVSLIGFSMEFVGSQVFNMWSYPNIAEIGPIILGVPLRWLIGWMFIGIFIMAFVRRYQEFFEIKSLGKIFEKY